MQKPKGYFYDHSLLESKVKGFKELTPQARHALRDILDKIWNSDELLVADDKELMKYVGYTENKWEKVKVELTSLSRNFLLKKDGVFTSKWLASQAGKVDILLKDYQDFVKSYDEIGEIEDFSLSNSEIKKTVNVIEQDNEDLDLINTMKNNLLFKEKKGNIGVNTRASILNSKILQKYARKGE